MSKKGKQKVASNVCQNCRSHKNNPSRCTLREIFTGRKGWCEHGKLKDKPTVFTVNTSEAGFVCFEIIPVVFTLAAFGKVASIFINGGF